MWLAVTSPPLDTLDAERVRIWHSVRRSHRCRLRVDILNDSGTVIRALVDRLAGHGIYNLYWDKRNDSGRFVPPGQYRYRVDDCGATKFGALTAAYANGERSSRLFFPDSLPSRRIGIELDSDSARVSIAVRNSRGMLIDAFVSDSLIGRGRHAIEWVPPRKGYRGVYRVDVTVEAFTHTSRLDMRRRQTP